MRILISTVFFFSFFSFSFAQEKLKTRYYHQFALGPQIAASYDQKSEYSQKALNYTNPSFEGVYKITQAFAAAKSIEYGLHAVYRNGNGVVRAGGLGGGYNSVLEFSVVRTSISVQGNFIDTKEGGHIGLSLYLGTIIWADGSVTSSGTSVISGSSETTAPIQNYLQSAQFGIGFNVSKDINIKTNRFITIGLALRAESAEMKFSKMGKMVSLSVGYKFGENIPSK